MKKFNLLARKEMKELFSDDLRKFRDEKCFTQEYMAKQLGIGQSAYYKLEAGSVKISLERLTLIARILNKPIEAFLEKEKYLKDSGSDLITISQREINLMQQIIIDQEKSIKKLEEEAKQKEDQIAALESLLVQKTK